MNEKMKEEIKETFLIFILVVITFSLLFILFALINNIYIKEQTEIIKLDNIKINDFKITAMKILKDGGKKRIEIPIDDDLIIYEGKENEKPSLKIVKPSFELFFKGYLYIDDMSKYIENNQGRVPSPAMAGEGTP